MRLDRMKTERQSREVPQWRLAEMIDSHQSYISKVERGMSVPREFAARVADALGCEIADLSSPDTPTVTLRLDELSPEQIAVLTKR